MIVLLICVVLILFVVLPWVSRQEKIQRQRRQRRREQLMRIGKDIENEFGQLQTDRQTGTDAAKHAQPPSLDANPYEPPGSS